MEDDDDRRAGGHSVSSSPQQATASKFIFPSKEPFESSESLEMSGRPFDTGVLYERDFLVRAALSNNALYFVTLIG